MEKTKNRVWPLWLVNIGLIAVVVGTAMPLFMPGSQAFRWVYSAGAAVSLVGQLYVGAPGESLRVKRLCRMEFFSALFFCVGAFFMFYQGHGVGATDWIAFTLAGAALRVYASLMMPRALRKEGDTVKKS